jgi:hypothetical protein
MASVAIEGVTGRVAVVTAPRRGIGEGTQVHVAAGTHLAIAEPRKLGGGARGRTLSRVPLGRFASPAEIASVVLFLLADASSYVVGETISVNGGSYLD